MSLFSHTSQKTKVKYKDIYKSQSLGSRASGTKLKVLISCWFVISHWSVT